MAIFTVRVRHRDLRDGCASLPAGPFNSWPASFLSGPAAATGFAVINSCGSIGGFVGTSPGRACDLRLILVSMRHDMNCEPPNFALGADSGSNLPIVPACMLLKHAPHNVQGRP